MSIEVEFKDSYKVNHNWFTRIHSAFLFYDGRKTNKIQKAFISIGLIIFRWFAFLALKKGFKFPTTGLYEKDKFPVRPTNSQFCSIYFQNPEKFYEVDVHGAIQVFLPENGLFIDIGANWGHHSFIAAKTKNASVIAFEPNPDVAEDFLEISKALDLQKSVKLFNYALGKIENDLILKQDYFESGLANITQDHSLSRSFSSLLNSILHKLTLNRPLSWTVKVKKLEDILDSKKSVDLIKIDAEGAEMDVLMGCVKVLDNDKPTIIFEINTSVNGKLKDFITFFNRFDYDLYSINSKVCEHSVEIIPITNLNPNRHYNVVAINKQKNIYFK